MARTRRLAVLAAVLALGVIGQAATADAAVPGEDDPDAAASAVTVPRGAGTHFENIGARLDWDPNRPCAGVDHSRDTETDVVLFACTDGEQGWMNWDIDLVTHSSGGTPVYQIRNPYTGFCLSVEGVESGASVKPDNGYDAQQEPCEKQHDALWWFSVDGQGHILVRLYLKNSAGRYPCLEVDNGVDPGDRQVQIWDCPSSDHREWYLRDSAGRLYP